MRPPDRQPESISVEAPIVSSISFRSGSQIEIPRDGIVVFCGPNNAGKSAALREIRLYIHDELSRPLVISSVKIENRISKDKFRERIKATSPFYGPQDYTDEFSYQGVGYALSEHDINFAYGRESNGLGRLAKYWTLSLNTTNRIMDSDPPKSIPILRSAPAHPIHQIQADRQLAETMSNYFHTAFGRDLIVHHGGGGEVPLYVGSAPVLEEGEHPLSPSYLKRLEHDASPLHEQGDGMRSFATVMLRSTAILNPAFLFIDEPEAFLHPPQARIIGEFLAKERRAGVQYFVATHSSDVIRGMLSTNDTRLIIVRIDRSGDENRIHLLDNDTALQIAREPLTRYTNILDTLFQDRVVACEADADSAFYSAISDAMFPGISRDVLFTHGNGKSSLVKICRALRALGSDTTAIVDIDILNEKSIFKALFEILGGAWTPELNASFDRFHNYVESKFNYLNVGAVKKEIAAITAGLIDANPLTHTDRKRILDVVKRSSPWDALKEAGRRAIVSGEPMRDFDYLQTAASNIGLQIVPVGQLESFCKDSYGGHGPAWLRNVLENYDLLTSPELIEAREFMDRILGR